MIKENVEGILKELKKDCTLIAVSKTKPVEMIKEAYDVGIRDFGENKVQELIDKMDKLPNDIKWHMIGHLQTNKIKYIIDKVYLIHSVDSIHLAEAINREAIKKNLTAKILLEINIANEKTKFGFSTDEITESLNTIKKLSNIEVLGLMCVAPDVDNSEDNRKYFRLMKELKDKLNLKILSMGMSNDYKIAIEEGSNYIRIGTKIFGERLYKND